MTLHSILTDVLLAVVVLSCWIGVVGMLRMREPMQALHYVGLPASLGVIALTGAVLTESGLSSLTLKTALIAAVLLAINSVVAHATARAFRVRELGDWRSENSAGTEAVSQDRPLGETQP